MFTLTIETDNAAFGDGDGRAEVARILRDIADKVGVWQSYGRCMDSNGNNVGEWELTK